MVPTGLPSTNWRDIFEYKDGWLYWKIRPSTNVQIGDRAGNKTGPGYWQICYRGKFYKLSRIIWEMHEGQIEDGLEIDHEDRDKDNNKIGNLRKVTPTVNQINKGAYKNNTTGFKGVTKSGRKFVAYSRVAGKTINLGRFDTPEEASEVYQNFIKSRV